MKRILFLTAMFVLAASATFAQSRKALRINEVMVQNESSIVDDYGEHHGWVELFNSNFAPLEISSVFITNDPNNPKKYPVPLGDVNTKIAKRQHVVFFADGQPDKGTFHMNFVLEPGKDNWIGVYDADGTTLIDEVTIPASLVKDNSYARTVDGAGEWSVRDGGKAYITPSSANVIRDGNKKWFRHDHHGHVHRFLSSSCPLPQLLRHRQNRCDCFTSQQDECKRCRQERSRQKVCRS